MQKHAARRLHYDFRLELDGVLLSWAVPKGPSLDPAEKRLAVETEDHPLEYASFEGTIPKGEYGAGTVLVWDRGTWEPEGDAREGLAKGGLTFRLNGKRLRGRWHLVRVYAPKDKSWLLFKSRDQEARTTGGSREIVDEALTSVESGRTLEQIAGKPDPRAHSAHARNGNTNASGMLDKLTNPGRVLYIEQGTTKRKLGEYYLGIADWILPHVSGRLLTLVRCPAGHHKECFYQKHAQASMPESIYRVPILEKGKRKEYTAIADTSGLLELVQLGVLEIHTWGSRVDDLERPDRIVFDLDPDPDLPWQRVIEGARRVRERLLDLGLESFVKTTGGKGLHVVVPIVPRLDWDEVKEFCRLVAEDIVRAEPSAYVSTVSKAKRKGKIFIDYLRNGRGATAICAFSTRARAGAPVATPLAWDELSVKMRGDAYNIGNLPRRLKSLRRDPWEGFFGLEQSISSPAWTKVQSR